MPSERLTPLVASVNHLYEAAPPNEAALPMLTPPALVTPEATLVALVSPTSVPPEAARIGFRLPVPFQFQ